MSLTYALIAAIAVLLVCLFFAVVMMGRAIEEAEKKKRLLRELRELEENERQVRVAALSAVFHGVFARPKTEFDKALDFETRRKMVKTLNDEVN